jgi:putative membrane protein insertion efficiency factor
VSLRSGEPTCAAAEADGVDGDSPGRLIGAARALVSAPIVVYQRIISPALPRRCRYEPTCSRYAVQAIGEYGILKGSVLAVWRLLRCNPLSRGGYDPVQAQGVFKSHPRVGAARARR